MRAASDPLFLLPIHLILIAVIVIPGIEPDLPVFLWDIAVLLIVQIARDLLCASDAEVGISSFAVQLRSCHVRCGGGVPIFSGHIEIQGTIVHVEAGRTLSLLFAFQIHTAALKIGLVPCDDSAVHQTGSATIPCLLYPVVSFGIDPSAIAMGMVVSDPSVVHPHQRSSGITVIRQVPMIDTGIAVRSLQVYGAAMIGRCIVFDDAAVHLQQTTEADIDRSAVTGAFRPVV